MQNSVTQRVVALVDMDCFYCQVETRLNPSLKGKPVAVVQYNQWKGGGIIAVNYEARDRGVTRHMRGDEAKEKCPDIVLVSVPSIRGKADLSNYRNAGDEVAKIFSEFSECVQRASIDEAYLDLTKTVHEYINKHSEDLSEGDLPTTFIMGYTEASNKNEVDRKKGLTEWLKFVENQKTSLSPDYCLAIGAIIIEKMRQEIFKKTGFHCSAGVAHNKILAKLTAGLHKPNKQTVLPQDSIPQLYETLPIYKVRSLGGKLGKQVTERLGIKFMSDLYKFTLQELQQKFDEKTSLWLYNIARGIDLEPVTSRLRPESIGCCKNFAGKNMLTTKSEVEHWLKELSSEISERLMKDSEKNKRKAKLLTVSFYQESAMSRCTTLHSYEISKIVNDALLLLKKHNNALPNEDVWTPPIKYLGLSASKFVEEVTTIKKFLKVSSNLKNEETLKSDEFLINEDCGSKFSAKKVETSTLVPQNKNVVAIPSTSKCQSISSFFMEFLDKKKDISVKEDNQQEKYDDEEMWISLSEIFPDINEAQSDLIEMLPKEMQNKFRERLNSNMKRSDQKELDFQKEESETCGECGKKILKSEVLEHSDYHTALKLYTEINRIVTVKENNLTKVSSKDLENQVKRKKKGHLTPSKKMKSITSFFQVVSKQ